MNLFYSDFDKRFLSAMKTQNAMPRTAAMTDADVLREMAEVWVASGGDAGGFTDEYVGKLRAEIKRQEAI